MATFPSVFVSHGAPTLLLDETETRAFLEGLGSTLGTPRGIVCASAHWEAPCATVSGSAAPGTIHDFLGFPSELYAVRYPAPGDPALARSVAALLTAAGIEAAIDGARGLDHGAWVPLKLAYPGADVPVVEISVQPGLGPAHHLEIGRALAPLREDGVLVLGSGGATHNLREFGRYAIGDPPAGYAREFDEWLRDAIGRGDAESLLSYADRGPHGLRNHPTPEHFLPILVPMGSSGPAGRGRRIHAAFEYGVLSMAAFSWD
ncbi:MAG: dioxygenase [Acidobacteriia bacterium]|nr:dioxygenase [Terriglobia bacterium]